TGSIRSRTCIRRLAVTWLPTPNRSYSTLRWRAPLNQSSASIVAGRQTTVKAGLRPPPSAADGPDSGLPSSPCWPPSVRWPGMNGFGKSDGAGLAVAPPIFDPAPDRRGFRQPSTRTAAADRSLAATPEQIDRAAAASGLDFTDEHGRAQLRAVHTLG